MQRRMSLLALEDRLVPAANYILTNEHADLQVNYAAGAWSTFVRDHDLGVDFPAESSLQYVNTAFAGSIRPAGSTFDFLGVPAGATYFRLPNLQNPNLLYHGIGAEDVAPGTFGVYDPALESKGRQAGAGRWTRLQLTQFSGPGTFSLFRNGDAGPVRFVSTFQDNISNPEADGVDYTDGLGPDDAFWVLEGSHVHLNFAFSAVGRYELTFRPSAIIGGSLSVGPAFKFIYSVQNVGQLGFQATSYTANEAAGNASISVVRTGGSDGAVSVDYATTIAGTATPDVDFTAVTGTLTFNDLETTKTFTIPLLNDGNAESAETVGLLLSNFRPWDKPGGGTEDPPIEGISSTATLTIQDDDSTPPVTVTGVSVNAGSVQRSRVTSVSVAFDQHIAPANSAFRLQRQSDSAVVGLSVSLDNSGPGTVATLTFGGAVSEFGSLLDGRYTLTVFAAQIPGLAADYTLIGTPTGGPKLYRLFGDADADGQVTNGDFLAFRLAFLSGSPTFDVDGSGQVSNADFLRFRLNFLATV
ncbi:MAG: choice-of-anchor M domain-containing protein [Gemmataceae bacterium]|nr:choice-of-anchor M domain-containing protein [Gemmataceae bacterium]